MFVPHDYLRHDRNLNNNGLRNEPEQRNAA